MSSSDEDVPLSNRRTSQSASMESATYPTFNKSMIDSESEDDIPLAVRRVSQTPVKKSLTAGTATVEKKTKKMIEESSPETSPVIKISNKRMLSSDSEDDVPLEHRIPLKKEAMDEEGSKSKPPTDRSIKKKLVVDSESEDDDVPLVSLGSFGFKRKIHKKKALKKEQSSPKSVKNTRKIPTKKAIKNEIKVKVKKEQQNDNEDAQPDEVKDEEYKWWLDDDKDDSIKWKTLEHSGPTFPPVYEPHGIKIKYKGKSVDLEPDAEEVATFFAALVGTDWAENPVFCKNFFDDFLAICKRQSKPCPIETFEDCDFSPITDYLQEIKEKKKNLTKEEKEAIKRQKQEIDEQFGWCLLDGRREKVGNFRIEPPGLFRGRGEHPKTGSLKLRVKPEQVTINIGSDAKIPEPPQGHKWGEVIHDNTVTWLAMWKENVNDNIKYVFLAANSSLKGQSDMKKFEKARDLKKHVNKIRQDYTTELKDSVMATRQRATAMYLIDRLALRAGNEKGEDEADTVGCCSLRVEHISLEPPNNVVFDFLGKDSIRYYNVVQVEAQVFKNLKLFKKNPKEETDPLFDRLTTQLLNKHLSSYMKGLTAKVFRTYNASWTFQQELQKTPDDGTVHEKVLAYNRANRQVAVLCNHQRSIPKSHGNQVNKMQDKARYHSIKALKYERKLVKEELLEIDPKLKKTMPQLNEPESDLDQEFIKEHLLLLEEKEIQKIKVKYEKLEDTQVSFESFKRNQLSKQKPSASIERLEKKLISLNDRLQAQKLLLVDKDEGKTTALSTSKINYIDPRISVAWCYKHEVPLEKIFNKSLREKFKWALDVDATWKF